MLWAENKTKICVPPRNSALSKGDARSRGCLQRGCDSQPGIWNLWEPGMHLGSISKGVWAYRDITQELLGRVMRVRSVCVQPLLSVQPCFASQRCRRDRAGFGKAHASLLADSMNLMPVSRCLGFVARTGCSLSPRPVPVLVREPSRWSSAPVLRMLGVDVAEFGGSGAAPGAALSKSMELSWSAPVHL